MLGEDLKEIPAFVEIHQDVVLLEEVDIFGDLKVLRRQFLPHAHVIRVGDGEEIDASFAEALDGGDDVVGSECDVLAAGAVVVLDEPGSISATEHNK